jgi:putative tryptophan/tyrosine transport system substrate-binding protein
VKRRTVIAGLGSAAVCATMATAQQRIRRIGVLLNMPADDPQIPVRVTALAQALQELGWTDGRNLRIDYRFAAADTDRIRKYAQELNALAPDAFVAEGSSITTALQQASRTIPIVFVLTSDPVGEGLVESLGRPGGNTTGFALWEYGISVKWLELLKEIAPNVTRAGVIRDRVITTQAAQFGAMQSVAPSLGVQLTPIDARAVGSEIERAVAAFARGPNGGLIVPSVAWPAADRERIVMLASWHRLPAVYPFRFFVTGGGLISYGPDTVDLFRRSAGYLDRILKGEKPADLPVQYPTRYETVINMKVAKALGLEVSAKLLARADEVIE